MALEYWLRGDIPPGPVKAIVLTDVNRVVEILRKFEGSSVIILGPGLKDIEKTLGIDVVTKFIELSKAINAPILTSVSDIVKKFNEVGFKNYFVEFPLEMVRKLSRGSKDYRLVIMVGLRYAYAWLLLNHLKHYRPEMQTLSLDPYAQPNATWTLPSLPLQIWLRNIQQIIDALKKE